MEIKDYCCYCGTCASICPRNALELEDDGRVRIDKEKCAEYKKLSCALCLRVCPVGAIVR